MDTLRSRGSHRCALIVVPIRFRSCAPHAASVLLRCPRPVRPCFTIVGRSLWNLAGAKFGPTLANFRLVLTRFSPKFAWC